MLASKPKDVTTSQVIDLRQPTLTKQSAHTWRGYLVGQVRRHKWVSVTCLLAAIALVVLIIISTLVRANPDKTALAIYQSQVSYRLFYPSNLPSYYFLDTGSISDSQEVIQFPIDRNDGQSIAVTEEPAAANFNLSQVTGSRYTVPGLGTMVVGAGFLGYRALIQTNSTLIILTCKETISQTDLTIIAKGFRAL